MIHPIACSVQSIFLALKIDKKKTNSIKIILAIDFMLLFSYIYVYTPLKGSLAIRTLFSRVQVVLSARQSALCSQAASLEAPILPYYGVDNARK